jgi:hypothetical protein
MNWVQNIQAHFHFGLKDFESFVPLSRTYSIKMLKKCLEHVKWIKLAKYHIQFADFDITSTKRFLFVASVV